jgi:hypothetical protein
VNLKHLGTSRPVLHAHLKGGREQKNPSGCQVSGLEAAVLTTVRDLPSEYLLSYVVMLFRVFNPTHVNAQK